MHDGFPFFFGLFVWTICIRQVLFLIANKYRIFFFRFAQQQADYDSFLKDRADTLRVYHSVNGDLSCLKNHYSVRGLEHSIRGNSSPIWQIQKDQKALVATVLAEQDRQNITGLVDPDALRHQAAMRTAKSMLQAFQRGQMDAVEATACEVDYEEDDDDSDEDHEDEGDVETESHCEKSLSSKAETASNSPPLDLPKNTAIGKLSCVDVMSLHNMNLHLLEQLRNPTNPKRLRPTKNGKGALLSPFDDLDKELEQWDALYENQRKRRDSLSKVSRPEVSTTKVTSSLHKDANVTLADATECAISIANLRCDSLRNMGESSSYSGNHSPSLLELQAQRRHRQTGLVPATLD